MENWSKQEIKTYKKFEKLIKIRQEDYEKTGTILSNEANKNLSRGKSIKIILIIIGALVTTKGVADQLMASYQKEESIQTILLITYTFLGLLITILAGLQTAFNYSEKAAGFRLLAAQTKTNIRRNMSSHTFSYHNEKFEEAMDALKIIIIDQNKQLEEIQDKSASLGLDLALKINIDYTIPSYFKE